MNSLVVIALKRWTGGMMMPDTYKREPWCLKDEKAPKEWSVFQGRREIATFDLLQDAQTAVASVNIMRGLAPQEPLA